MSGQDESSVGGCSRLMKIPDGGGRGTVQRRGRLPNLRYDRRFFKRRVGSNSVPLGRPGFKEITNEMESDVQYRRISGETRETHQFVKGDHLFENE